MKISAYSLYTEVFIIDIDFTLIVEVCVVSLEAALNTDLPHNQNTKTLWPLSCSCNTQHTSLLALISFQLEESSLGNVFEEV
jgi:hypothetical protein